MEDGRITASQYYRLLGAARQIVLVDNLGGIDSDLKANGVAVFQNGVIAIDIDAFRDDVVLKDVIEHELWHSILEIVESNPAIAEATAIYQNLKVFSEMPEQEQNVLIAFLGQADNGLQSQNYAGVLQNILDNKVKGDGLIALAISYVVNEPRYGHLVDALTSVLSPGGEEGIGGSGASVVKKAEEKLQLAKEIYQDIAKAIAGFAPAIK